MPDGTRFFQCCTKPWARDPANGLTAYRTPKRIELRDSLPETMVGKVLRRVLAEEERQKAATPIS